MAELRELEYYLAQARRISAHREADAEKEIRKLYKELLDDLQQFLSQTYIQYAQNDQLTYAMLQEKGYNARFLEEIEQRLNISTPKSAMALRSIVEVTYTLAYHSMVDGVVKSYFDPANHSLQSVFGDSLAITPEQIKAAVENPVSGLTLSDTLEKNRRDIIYNIKKTIGVGLMNGDRYTTMARRIAQCVDGDYRKAIRIVRTETHRVRESGELDAALKVDAELQNGTTGMRMVKKWKTMKDERVRPNYVRNNRRGGWTRGVSRNGANHVRLEGQMVLVDEPFDLLDGHKAMAPSQSGVASHDINCRCLALKYMMTDDEYFKATGKHFPVRSGD